MPQLINDAINQETEQLPTLMDDAANQEMGQISPITQSSNTPMLKIRNKATGEIKSITAGEAQNYGQNPAEALNRLEAQSEIERIERGEPEKAEELEKTKGTVKELLRQYERVPDIAKGPLLGLFAKTIPGLSAEAKRFEKSRRGLAGTLKDIVGETGVLTDADIDRITALIPSVTETKEETDLAIEDLKSFLKTRGIELEAIDEAPKNVISAVEQETGQEAGIMPSDLEDKVAKQALETGTPTETAPTSTIQSTLGSVLDKVVDVVDAIMLPGTKKLYEQQKQQQRERPATVILEAAFPPLELLSLETGEPTKIDTAAVQVAAEVGLTLFLSSLVKKGMGKLGYGGGKLVEKRQVMAKATEATIDGEKLAEAIITKTKNVSPADIPAVEKYVLKSIEKYGGKQIGMDDAVDLYVQANKAFNASGKVGKSAKAVFNKSLRDALREQLPQEILDITSQMAKQITTKEFLKKIINPISIGSGIAGTAIYKTAGKFTGEK